MNIVSIVIACFSILGAIDYILGNKFGIGKEFEKGFHLMGTMSLSMIGMMILAPLISHLLSPILSAIPQNFPFEPSVIAGSLLANDMGGAPLAANLAKTELSGFFNGLVVGSMMGATISFTLPFALGVVKKEQHKNMLLGLLCGIVAIPSGCFVSGLMIKMPITELIINLVPLIIFAIVLAISLFNIPDICLKFFKIFGVIIKTLITCGLAIGLFTFLTDIEILPHIDSFENGALVVFNAAAVMTGAFPLFNIIGRLVKTPLQRIGKTFGINNISALGFLSSLATSITTFGMMQDMDNKGVILNSAFAVSAAFTFGGHLAFTMSFNSDYLPAVITGKLISGIVSVIIAQILYSFLEKKGTFSERENQTISN